MKNQCNDYNNAININTLKDFFETKFADHNENSQRIQSSHRRVENLYSDLCEKPPEPSFIISEHQIRTYIKQLKSGSAPGLDGVMAEHLKYGINTILPLFLSVLFSLCVRHGTVPKHFCEGLLIPILKKHNLDPSIPSNYRPITVSVIPSKILEFYVLDQCKGYQFSPSQYGFIPGRSTHMAATLAGDISTYCQSRGSTVYYCSLDAEGAYDALPHSILFDEAHNAMPNAAWRLMYYWYRNMTVLLRWNNTLSLPIKVEKGTRQGGITSPLFFNIFYRGLVDKLQQCNCGIIINGQCFNVICYADDLLLTSTTVTGLQTLIDTAISYICDTGLKFNPNKTTCMVSGRNHFVESPIWTINGVALNQKDNITYLGTELDHRQHNDARVRSATKEFHALQGVGLNQHGMAPLTSLYVYDTAVKSCLLYGCSNVYLTKNDLHSLETTRCKHLKSILGIGYSSHSKPILQALNECSIANQIKLSSFDLLCSCLISDTTASLFYHHLIKLQNNTYGKTLVNRIEVEDINFQKYCLDVKYRKSIKFKQNWNIPEGQNGVVDSIRAIINNYDDNGRMLLRDILKSF